MDYDFKFDIGDVSNLLGIRRIGNGDGSSFGVECPFCGDKRGKMNFCISKNGTLKNTYHCYNCGSAGNMLGLYAELRGINGDEKGTRFHYAKLEIENRLFGGDKSTYELERQKKKMKKRKEQAKEGVKMTDITVINHTYRMMLDLIPLRKEHQEDLKRRGLSEAQIKKYLFRSTPKDTRSLCRRLIKNGCIIKGVPGFYMNEHGEWDLNFYKGNSGYLCPVFTTDGQVCGFQIRLDNPKGSRKYVWLTSAGKKYGTSSKAPATFIGDIHAKKVIVTEGVLKAVVAYCLFNGKYSFVGTPGISNINSAISAINSLPDVKAVSEAYDMDKLLKPVCKHDCKPEKCQGCSVKNGDECLIKREKQLGILREQDKLQKKVQKAGYTCSSFTWDKGKDGFWDENYKGIDDYALHLRKEREDGR